MADPRVGWVNTTPRSDRGGVIGPDYGAAAGSGWMLASTAAVLILLGLLFG